MSDIRANTISDAAGNGPINLTGQSAAKAWVNLSGIGVIAINDSINVSSADDNGTGNYTIHMSNSMINASFAATASTWQSSSISGTGTNVKEPTTSTQPVDCVENEVSTDPSSLLMTIHGDLA